MVENNTGADWYARAARGAIRWIGEDDRHHLPSHLSAIRTRLVDDLRRTSPPAGVEVSLIDPWCFWESCGLILVAVGPEEGEVLWIGDADGEHWSWRPSSGIPWDDPTVPDKIGAHDHGAAWDPSGITYYLLHPTGPFKTRRIGSSVDVILAAHDLTLAEYEAIRDDPRVATALGS